MKAKRTRWRNIAVAAVLLAVLLACVVLVSRLSGSNDWDGTYPPITIEGEITEINIYENAGSGKESQLGSIKMECEAGPYGVPLRRSTKIYSSAKGSSKSLSIDDLEVGQTVRVLAPDNVYYEPYNTFYMCYEIWIME